jgi:hypothetical protein
VINQTVANPSAELARLLTELEVVTGDSPPAGLPAVLPDTPSSNRLLKIEFPDFLIRRRNYKGQ